MLASEQKPFHPQHGYNPNERSGSAIPTGWPSGGYREGSGVPGSLDDRYYDQLDLCSLPLPSSARPRAPYPAEQQLIDIQGTLQFFLATAPSKWTQPDTPLDQIPLGPDIHRFRLPDGDYVSCVLWNGLYYITGTDIVRALSFRFEAFGRPVTATKKWEEGVFSDLRNLKPGTDACLEEPKSPLLDYLFRNGCIRTQKKQKVFYWFSVPHDRLFLDALERDLKREKAGQESTTSVRGEPGRSFQYDPRRGLFEQFAGLNPGMAATLLDVPGSGRGSMMRDSEEPSQSMIMDGFHGPLKRGYMNSDMRHEASPILLEGSPNYKRRRRFRPWQFSGLGSNGQGQEYTPGPGDSDSASARDTPGRENGSWYSGNEGMSGDEDRREMSEMTDGRVTQPKHGKHLSPNPQAATTAATEKEEKNFICVHDFCRRSFKRLEHLKRHLRTHTQEKPFACPICSRSFSRQDNLLQHARHHKELAERGVSIQPRGGGMAVDQSGGGVYGNEMEWVDTQGYGEDGSGEMSDVQSDGQQFRAPMSRNTSYSSAMSIPQQPMVVGQMYPSTPLIAIDRVQPSQNLRHSTLPPDWALMRQTSIAPRMNQTRQSQSPSTSTLYPPAPVYPGIGVSMIPQTRYTHSPERRFRSETPWGGAGTGITTGQAHPLSMSHTASRPISQGNMHLHPSQQDYRDDPVVFRDTRMYSPYPQPQAQAPIGVGAGIGVGVAVGPNVGAGMVSPIPLSGQGISMPTVPITNSGMTGINGINGVTHIQSRNAKGNQAQAQLMQGGMIGYILPNAEDGFEQGERSFESEHSLNSASGHENVVGWTGWENGQTA